MTFTPTYKKQLLAAREHLFRKGVRLETGLSEEELQAAENQFHFVFPPDLKWFLKLNLPICAGSNWHRTFCRIKTVEVLR